MMQTLIHHTEVSRPDAVRRVAVYCRVSTPIEVQEHSFDQQCEAYRTMADNDPTITLVGIYGDLGKSGKSTKHRPEFQRMVADCMDGKIDLVMTKSISRFARNLADCVETVRQLRQKGVAVLFEKEGICSTDENCELLLSILASIAQEELNSISKNIWWAVEHRAAAGDPARRAAYGFYREQEQKGGMWYWRINEREAARVQAAFSLAEQGVPYADICRHLNGMEEAEGTGVKWTRQRIQYMFRNEAYIGNLMVFEQATRDYLSHHTERNTGFKPRYYIEEHHAPIVSEETFRRVGELMKMNVLRTTPQRKALYRAALQEPEGERRNAAMRRLAELPM